MRPWRALVLVGALTATALVFGVNGTPNASAAAAPVALGTASSFAVLAGSTVTNTGATTIVGDLGLSPGTAVTGFPPGTVAGGVIHAADATAGQAQADLASAYAAAAAQTPATTLPVDIGGQTLTPGVYNSGSSIGLTGTVTLDGGGDPNAVFVIQAGSTLITASNSVVALAGGTQACNVFWQVGSSATLGTGTAFKGSILALTSITVTTGVTIAGRILAGNGAVTLDTNAITVPTCTPGALSISVPASKALGSGAPGTDLAAQLGTVTVTDARAANPAGWIATVTGTGFVTGAGRAGEVIPATAISYSSGAATAASGTGTCTPSGSAVPLGGTTALTAFSHVGGAGGNSCAWNPTLVVSPPPSAVGGVYTGTVTFSVG